MNATMQQGFHRNRRLVAVSLAAVVALGIAAPVDVRASRPENPFPGKTVSAAEARQTRGFDFRDVMRRATPAVAPSAGLDRPVDLEIERPEGPAELHGGSAPNHPVLSGAAGLTAPEALPASQNGAWSGAYNRNPNRQIGKLFYDIKPGPGEIWRHCSATVVNSENKSTVVTAGHCVFTPDPDKNGRVDGNGYWYEHIQFCPGYEFGCRLGKWRAKKIYTTHSWFNGTGTAREYDWRDDVAMIIMKPHATKGRIANAVGSQGIAFNQSTGLLRHSFGYPMSDHRWPAYSYSGDDLIYCRGRDTNPMAGILAIACTMTGGASGGPWLISPNRSWGGYVNSVNSHKPWGGAYMGGPYFGKAEKDLFGYVRAR